MSGVVISAGHTRNSGPAAATKKQKKVFQRGVSEGHFRPLGGSPERFCVMYPGGNFVKIPPPEGQIGQGTSTERFLFENQCRRWPRRPCGQLGVFIFSDDVGKTLFPGGCFRGVFQRGVSEGCFRPLGLRDRPAQGNLGTHPHLGVSDTGASRLVEPGGFAEGASQVLLHRCASKRRLVGGGA